jgi:hypothetical protein
MAEFQQLEFFVLRYAGDATKGESINLGVVAISANRGQDSGFADVRFISNWGRLRCFDPLVDVEELHAIEREIRLDLQDPLRREESLKRLNDCWSNVIRFDRLQGCLTESPALEMERFSALYLETPAAAEKRELSGRQRVLSVVRDELDKAGVLALMRANVAVAEFTRPGDPLKLDFGYAVGAESKFLHAVSLVQRHGVEQGMMLAARFLQIAEGIRAKTGAKAWLTAVVDDEIETGRDDVKFTLDLMQENGIAVARASEMHYVAEGIRLELLP